jgi:CheY-like chemotaxis protein
MVDMATDKKPVHVLLADDDSDDCFLFDEALSLAAVPAQFTRVDDGKRLMEYLENERVPDVLFLDINMPIVNGIECLKEIRANKRFKNLPIVIYSTTNYSANIDACFKAGANLYVIKPSSFDEIIKMIRTICTPEWTSNVSSANPEYFIKEKF